MNKELRSFWRRLFSFNWKFGLFLILLVCIPRFILVLYANTSNNYGFIGLIMLVSAIFPFVFLTKQGQKDIGITKPKAYSYILLALIAGLIFSLLLFHLGFSLYGNSYENWYRYIGKSYAIPPGIAPDQKSTLFIIFAITGMTFSPIGEELFFRGIVHSSFSKSLSHKKASLIDASAFALTHLSHFGFVFINQEWKFLPLPALIWVSSMFLVSILFMVFRKYSGSILGAMCCHAGFNLGMTYCIFYL